MSKWKRLAMATISTSILLTQGGPLPYLASAAVMVNQVQINGDVTFSWTTPDQVMVGTTFNPYEGLQAMDADGDNVAVLVQVAGEVDTSRVGIYSITYSIKNVDDENFTITRQIEVVASNSTTDAVTEKSPVLTEQETKEPDSQEEAIKDSSLPEEIIEDEGSKDEIKEETTPSDPNLSVLNEITWTLYDRINQQEWIKFNVNVETGYYEGQISPLLTERLMGVDDHTLSQEVLNLRIWSNEQEEKLSTTLTVRDLLGEADELNSLNELPYEIGDQISLIPISNETTLLRVNGIVGGDISNEQADYENGVKNEDYLHNVRFQLTEDGLKTIYNEAPSIEGIQDTIVSDFKTFDPIAGVMVKDDHDENLLPHLIHSVEYVDETTQKIIYQVTDSWGRTTKAIRQITKHSDRKAFINPLTGDQETSPTRLIDNTIEIHGISYGTYGTNTLRMKVVFNQNTRRIYVTERDGLRFNSRVTGTYFKLIQFSSNGKIKNQIDVLGTDKSSDAKLDELEQIGWRFEYGDRLFLWHHQSDRKLMITGTVQNADGLALNQGMPSSQLLSTRFELTQTGLKRITNTPPTIIFLDNTSTVTVKRGDIVNLMDSILIQNADNEGGHETLEITDLDTSVIGEHQVTYTVTDEWGLTTTANRTYKVIPKNQIEEVDLTILTNNRPSINISFDEITNQLKAESITGDQETNRTVEESEVTLTIYTENDKVRRRFTVSTDAREIEAVVQEINGFSYKPGDYLNITSVTPSRIRINGEITDKPAEVDYTSGSVDMDYLQNVRFQLSANGTLNYVYNEAPHFHSVGELTVTRGDSFSYTEGISITDDHDGTFELTDDMVQIKINSGDPTQVGEVEYTMTYTDSWGRSSQFTRTLFVNPPTILDIAQIKLMKENNDFLTIGFDELTKALKVISYTPNDWISGNESDTAFELKLYGSDRQEKQTVTLNFQQTINSSFVQQLENITYAEGDYLTIVAYDHTKLKIIKNQDSEQTLATEDEMIHSRLELTDDGIKVVYNKAPIFKGVDDVKIVYGTNFNNTSGVSVTDEDEHLKFTVTGNVNTNQLGSSSLTYTTTDSYGRKTQVTRTITVVPVYTTNEIEYYDNNNRLQFAIGINEAATGFTYRLGDAESLPPSDSTEPEPSRQSTELDGEEPNPPILDQTEDEEATALFRFNVYDEVGNLVTQIKVDTSTIINEELFASLQSTIVHPGYRFSVTASDLTQLKVTGRIETAQSNQTTETQHPNEGRLTPPSQEEQEPSTNIDYENLTEDQRDKVDNVRFELTDNIIKTIYNKAPILRFTNNSSEVAPLVRDKSLTKEAYNLLDGIAVSDDKDTFTLDVTDVTVPPEMLASEIDQSVQTIGETYQVSYQVTDSWGRKSNILTRNVQIKSAMDDVELVMYQQPKGTNNPENKAFTIGFDVDNKQWIIKKHITTPNAVIEGNQFPAYAMVVTDKNGTQSFNYLFGGRQQEIIDTSQYINVANTLQDIENALSSQGAWDYGTVIQLRSWKEDFLKINGTIINAKEDYSEGATIDEYLMNSKFIVSPEGLRQVYTPTEHTDAYQRITWYNGINGLKEFSLVFNQENQSITFEQETDQVYDIKADGSYAFKIHFHFKDNTVKTYTAKGGNGVLGSEYRPAHFREWLNQNNITTYENIDYITLLPREERIRNLRIEGPISYHELTKEENDFSQGATDLDYFKNVRFYLRDNGIVAAYNKAPELIGAEDTDVLIRTSFNVREGVTVTDVYDGTISNFTVSPETIDTTQLGSQTITYTATDSWGRTTTHTRQINVRPLVFDNKFQVFSTSDLTTPAFELILDHLATSTQSRDLHPGVYRINRLSDTMLDINHPTTEVFKIWIMNKNNEPKASVTLLGRDTARSDKLDVLETIAYESGDYLKVWRLPSSMTNDDRIETLKITGTIRGEDNNDYNTGTFTVEYMNNVVFQVPDTNDAHLKAIYNKAPEIIGAEDQVIYYGDSFVPLDNIVVSDDKDSSLSIDIDVSSNVNPNRIGTYMVTYTITDSWGRTSLKTIHVEVRSKVTKNTFEIYQSHPTTKSKQKLVTIGFNAAANRLVINPDSTVVVPTTKEASDSSVHDFQFTVYNRFGQIKSQVQLSQDELGNTSNFDNLASVTIENGDMISVISKDPSNVHITETVVNQTHNYETGFSSTDEMKQVRFKVTNNGLEEIQQTTATISGQENPIKTKRTIEPNFLEGMTVTHPHEEFTPEQVKVSGYNLSIEGAQTITYTVTDSWGHKTTATRQLIVEPFNQLEDVSITLKDATTSRLTVGFDAVEKKLTADLKDTSVLREILGKVFHFTSLPSDIPVMEVAIFLENGTVTDKVTLMASDLTEDSSQLQALKELSFNYGDYLGINVYNYENGLEMTGPIRQPRMNYDSYSMDSVRYQITEDGLLEEYNEAPSISLTQDSHFIGELINFKELITLEDDRDIETELFLSVTSENYDAYKIGNYQITVTATDSWERRATQTFEFSVLSYLEKSMVTFQNNQGKELAKLSFDSRHQQLKWTFNTDNQSSFIEEANSSSVQKQTDSSDNLEMEENNMNLLFKIHIYDTEGTQRTMIPVSKTDTVTSFQKKLTAYLDYQYHYGYFINIEMIDDKALDCIRISNVATSHLPDLNESTSSENGEFNIDYNEKLENADYFTHVRFELDPYGLDALYNKAPVLTNTGMTELSSIKNIDVETYGLLDDITVQDDYDLINLEELEILYNGEKNPENLHLGSNKITYTAIDSWGRRSQSIERNLNLSTAMNDIEINMSYLEDTTQQRPDNAEILKIKFIMDETSMDSTGSLLVTNPNSGQYSNFIKPTSTNSFTYPAYAIRIKNKNGDVKYQKLFGGTGRNGQFNADSSSFGGHTNNVNDVIGELNKLSINYGDQIELRTYASGYLVINGQIVNAKEEYSEGAYLDDILSKSYFEVTENGLQQFYQNTTSTPEHTNKLIWLSGASGSPIVELTMTHPTVDNPIGTFNVTVPRNQRFDVTSSNDEPVFKIELYRPSIRVGEPINTYSALGGDRGTLASDFQSQLNTWTFRQGDYLRIWVKTTLKNNIRLYGETTRIGASIQSVDYTDSIPNLDYYNETYFYFDHNNQLTLFYNEAPKFEGLDDIIILKEKETDLSTIKVNLLEGVSVEDEDGKIDYTITDSNGNMISKETAQEYPITSLGIQTLIYEVTDSFNRTTRESRFILIQQQSELTINDNNKLIIQQSDPTLQTEEAKMEYLKSLVNIFDLEDFENSIPLEFKEGDITGQLNVNTPGDYPIHYQYQDSDGNITELDLTITVVRSINVSVPRNNIPFQVVTNLLGDETEGKEFISGTMKIQNNYVTDVQVSVLSLTVSENQSSTRNGIFELVNPSSVSDWTALSEEETMSKMALGLYQTSGTITGDNVPTKNHPIWLTTNMTKTSIGILPKGTLLETSQLDSTNPVITPSEATLSFTAKYGKNFTAGKHRMKFTMVLEFE